MQDVDPDGTSMRPSTIPEPPGTCNCRVYTICANSTELKRGHTFVSLATVGNMPT